MSGKYFFEKFSWNNFEQQFDPKNTILGSISFRSPSRRLLSDISMLWVMGTPNFNVVFYENNSKVGGALCILITGFNR